ncbi:MAG: hypothetical protein ACYSTL_03855 [Planctomycetota bacterium]|jgi:uncharacterized tellurite resistance protein B-like protein
MNDEAKRNLRNVMVMTLVDKKLSQKERRFVEELRIKLGISDEEFRELVEQVREDRKTIALPKGEKGGRQAVELLISVAMADGELAAGELKALRKVATCAGMSGPEFEKLLALQDTSADEDQINARVDDIYADFGGWDEATQHKKLSELASMGRAAATAMLHILESYRVPEGASDALVLKVLIAEHPGALGDDRAVYYLAQQVTIGDSDDEITNSALRCAGAEAIGKIVGEPFTRDQAGVEAVREWWRAPASDPYDRLAF